MLQQVRGSHCTETGRGRSEPISFRKACLSDFNKLRQICRVLFPIVYSNTFYHKMIIQIDYHCFFIYQGCLCIGVCSVQIESHYSYLLVFGLLPEFRGQGLGTASLSHIERFVSNELRVSTIYLHVQINNLRAKSFYLNNGYLLVDIKQDYYTDIFPAEAYVFMKNLS